MNQDKPTQADLFGAVQKREQSKRAVIEKNKADKAAGVKPVQEPLLTDTEDADQA